MPHTPDRWPSPLAGRWFGGQGCTGHHSTCSGTGGIHARRGPPHTFQMQARLRARDLGSSHATASRKPPEPLPHQHLVWRNYPPAHGVPRVRAQVMAPKKGSKAAAAKPAAAKPAAKRAASAPPERPTTAANEPPPVAQPQGAAEETNLAGPLEELPAGKAYESADDEDGPAAVLEGEELVAVPEVLPALTGDAQDKRQSPTRAQNVATRVAEKTKPMTDAQQKQAVAQV